MSASIWRQEALPPIEPVTFCRHGRRHELAAADRAERPPTGSDSPTKTTPLAVPESSIRGVVLIDDRLWHAPTVRDLDALRSRPLADRREVAL